MKKNYKNVQEAWTLYDTLFVTDKYYGTENSSLGWYNTFVAFSQQAKHSFFNLRTEATAGLAYCNKQVADTMDYVFYLYSIGVSFFSPGIRTLGKLDGQGAWETYDSTSAHYWEVDLPRHCSISFKVQQDTIVELPCFGAPPGYGPVGGGASFEHTQIGYATPNGLSNDCSQPVMNASVTSGVPVLSNRYKFEKPIGIPRTATIEAVVDVSELARNTLAQLEPMYYPLRTNNSEQYNSVAARYGIQVSLLGKREVQQRGSYHR